MSISEWLLGFAISLLSPWLVLPAFLFLVWAVLAVRIIRRHDVSMEDFPERAEEQEP